MPTLYFPEDPSLDHLRGQARTLLRKLREGDEQAAALFAEHHPRPPATPRLADAQLAWPGAYGFPSWPALRRHLDVVGRAHPLRRTRSPRADDAGRRAAAAGLPALRRRRPARPGPGHRDAGRRTPRWAARRSTRPRPPATCRPPSGCWPPTRGAAVRPAARFDWVPLLYLAYSRHRRPRPADSRWRSPRLLLRHGADPNAGYLWEGICAVHRADRGVRRRRGRRNQPPHRDALALARLLLEAGRRPQRRADPLQPRSRAGRRPPAAAGRVRARPRRRRPLGPAAGRGRGAPRPRCWRTSSRSPRSTTARGGRGSRWPPAPTPTAAAPATPSGTAVAPYELAVRRGNREVAGAAAGRGRDRAAARSGGRAALRLPGRRPAAVGRWPPIRRGGAGRARRRTRCCVAAEVGRAPGPCGCSSSWASTCTPGGDATPLHQAAYAGNVAMVELLLELGADPARRDARFDATPLGWAEHNHQDATAALLRDL